MSAILNALILGLFFAFIVGLVAALFVAIVTLPRLEAGFLLMAALVVLGLGISVLYLVRWSR